MTTKSVSPWAVLSVTTLGSFLASIQGSALILGLPDVMVGLGSNFETILWVMLGYLLASTVVVPLIGRLSDIYGRHLFYNIGFALFTLSSILAGFAQPQFHAWDLVAARVLQGFGGALLFANSTALVTDAFGTHKVGTALGFNQMALAAGFVLGPLVGGLLTQISWRWIFWINGPLGLIGTIWGIIVLPRDRGEKESGHFDLRGTAFFLLGMIGFLTALSLIAMPGISWILVVGMAVLGLIFLFVFARIEAGAEHPFLHLELFTDRRLSLPNLAAALNGLARGAVLFLLTFYLQGPYGLSPFMAGIATAPFGLSFMIFGPWAGRISDRWNPGALSTIGLVVSAVGLAGLSFVGTGSPYWFLAIFMALMGAGSGLFNSPNIKIIMSRVLPHQRGITSATRMLLLNGGQMLALAIVFPFVLSRIPEDVMTKVFLYGGGMGDQPAVASSLLNGIRLAFLISFIISAVAAVISYVSQRDTTKANQAEAEKVFSET